MEETLMKLIEYLETMAPAIWNAAVSQAYISGVQYIVVAMLLLGLTPVLIHFSRKRQAISHADRDDEDWAIICLCGIAAIATAVTAVVLLVNGTSALFNPEWKAINILIESIR